MGMLARPSTIESARIDAALVVLREAVELARHDMVQTNGVRLALRVLRRHVDDVWLKQYWDGAGSGYAIGRTQEIGAAMNGIERNLKVRRPG